METVLSKLQVIVGYYYQRVHSQNETIRKVRPWPPYGFKPVLTIRKKTSYYKTLAQFAKDLSYPSNHMAVVTEFVFIVGFLVNYLQFKVGFGILTNINKKMSGQMGIAALTTLLVYLRKMEVISHFTTTRKA